VSVCIGVHLFAGQSNIMPRRRANVGRRTRRAERATATRGGVQLVITKYVVPRFIAQSNFKFFHRIFIYVSKTVTTMINCL
jgi:hypothetical protein